MQEQAYCTGFCLKASVILQERFVKYMVLDSILVPSVVAAITFVSYLVKDAYATATILSFAMGHAHNTLSTIQHVVAENPWPKSASALPHV